MFETVYLVWLAVMTTVAPHEPPERLSELARAVVAATPDPVEQAVLLDVDFHETTWGRPGIRFGLSGVRTRLSLRDAAPVALRYLRRARDICSGGRWERFDRMFGFYHHGNGCAPDAYSRGEAAFYERLYRLYWVRYAQWAPVVVWHSVQNRVNAWVQSLTGSRST